LEIYKAGGVIPYYKAKHAWDFYEQY
jgi:hypothetical protein